MSEKTDLPIVTILLPFGDGRLTRISLRGFRTPVPSSGFVYRRWIDSENVRAASKIEKW
jgi:hypothetical protein